MHEIYFKIEFDAVPQFLTQHPQFLTQHPQKDFIKNSTACFFPIFLAQFDVIV